MNYRITKIEIEYYKGIEIFSHTFQELFANQLHLFVAPNGFGKTSLAHCFSNLIQGKLKPPENHLHNDDSNKEAKLLLSVRDDKSERTLTADRTKNEISKEFDIAVINTRLISKTKQGFGNIKATSKLAHDELVLVQKIPNAQKITYNLAEQKRKYKSYKHHINDIPLLIKQNEDLALSLMHWQDKKKLSLATVSNLIKEVQSIISGQKENAFQLSLIKIKGNKACRNLLEILGKRIKSEEALVLAFLQTVEIIISNTLTFDNYCKRAAFDIWKERVSNTLTALNPSFYNAVKLETKKGQLVFNLENFEKLSNGQRDILSFLSQIYSTEYEFKHLSRRDKCILIVDEIFDYLDEANIVTCQYFMSELISSFKKSSRIIFPIILTHLSPKEFDSYAIKKMKSHFLAKTKRQYLVDETIRLLLKGRNDKALPSVEQNEVAKYYLHYHPTDFHPKGDLAKIHNFESSHSFYQRMIVHLKNYNSGGQFDPFAVCVALRIVIERHYYKSLTAPTNESMIETWKTADKLQVAEEHLFVPDHFYLLGIIYNNCLHTSERTFNFTEEKLMNQLSNITVNMLIKSVSEVCCVV